MKKLLSLLIVCILLVLCINPAFSASGKAPVMKTTIGVIMDGVRIRFERQPVVVNGRLMVPVRSALQNLGIRVDWTAADKSIRLEKNDTVINMKIGDKNYKVDGEARVMDVEPILLDGITMVPIRFVGEALKTDVIWDGENNAVRINTGDDNDNISRGGTRIKSYAVVIDAGHGGKDPGAIYGGISEKDLNLDIAKRLYTLLENQGIQLYMTRTNDTYIDLYDRSGLANKVNADLLISVHNNAGPSGTTGSMSLYYPGMSKSNGNLSPAEFAGAISESPAKKVLIPLNRCNIEIVGVKSEPLPHHIDNVITIIKNCLVK